MQGGLQGGSPLQTPLHALNHTLYLHRCFEKNRSGGFFIYVEHEKNAIMSKLDLPDWHDWVDAQDVVDKLHISLRTLQRWRISGVLPYSRVNGKCYYRKSDVLMLLMNNYNGEKGGNDE